MKKIITLSIVLLCLVAQTAHGMFGKRKKSQEKKDERALLKTTQDGTPQLQQLPQKRISKVDENALRAQLRQVLKISDSSSSSSSRSGTSSSESVDPALFKEPSPISSPTTTKAPQTLIRSHSLESVLAPASTPIPPFIRVESTSRLITVEEYDQSDSDDQKPKSPYHNRHMLGLMVEWLGKLPLEKFDIVGGHLEDAEKVQLITSLKSVAIAVTTNVDDDSADDEKLLIDLTKLVGYKAFITQPRLQSVHSAPASPQEDQQHLCDDRALVLTPNLSPEEEKLRLLLATTPDQITLWQGEDVARASDEQKTKAYEWIIKTVQAIQQRQALLSQQTVLGIDLSRLPQSTKVHAPKSDSPGAPQTPSIFENIAWTALKGISLISLGYLIAQLAK